MHTDPSSTSTSAEPLPDGEARKPSTSIGLLGLTVLEAEHHDEQRPLRSRPPRRHLRLAKILLTALLPVGVMIAAHRASEPEGLDAAELASLTSPSTASLSDRMPGGSTRSGGPPSREFAPGSFGYSGAVRVRVVLPNQPLQLPIAFGGSTDSLQAQWIAFDGSRNESSIPFPGNGVLRAPSRPGAFWLVLSRAGIADTVADLALLVEYPMPNARATGINGYHLGRWPTNGGGTVPRGFIEVRERLSDFQLSPHLRLSDFVVHDQQNGYPKYLHVREPLLDKIELVVSEVAQMRGLPASSVKLNVASGFRSPSYNGSLSSSASDSRHMYGDAADIAIDANDDGRLTEIDARLVAAAAEVVERKHPDLVGGIGLYFTPDGAGWPYVHIDVRGTRARWRSGRTRGAKVDSLPPGVTFDTVATPLPSAVSAAPQPTVSPPGLPGMEPSPAASLPPLGKSASVRARQTVTPPGATRPGATLPAAAATRAPIDPSSGAARKFPSERS